MAERAWNFALFTAAEPGRRNRRTIDAVLAGAAAIVAGLAAVVARSARGVDEEIGEAFTTLLGWAPTLCRVAFLSALALALIVVADLVIRRRWLLARDLLVALVLLGVAGSVLTRIVESHWVAIEAHLFSRWGFPELRLAAAVAVLSVAGPELVRPVRVLAIWFVGFLSLGAVALGAALPSEVLGGLALGLGVSALVRLLFGSAAGVPPTERVRAALVSLGVPVEELRIAERQQIGAAAFVGLDANGDPLKVRVLGRDAQETHRIARYWRLLTYKDPPRSVAAGRLEQVEHEALATLMAAQASVRVPQVVIAALGPDGDALVVTHEPDIEPLEHAAPDQVSDELLEELWRQVARLHAAGIAHGRLNAENVLVVDGAPMLVELSAATLGAPQFSLDSDVAELLVASSVLVGPERALRAVVDAGASDSIARVLPYLQPAALTPHLRELAHSHDVGLKDLRAAAAAATGTEEPKIAPLRRVRLKDLALIAFLIFAANLIVTQLAEIGFDTLVDVLRDADLAWVLVGLILAQSTFVASGVSLRGAVATPLALLPCVVLQSAIKFINLTVPSSAGRIGMNLRFLQRMGVPRPQAVAAGAVDDVSETVVQVGLLLLALPFVQGKVDTSRFHGTGPNTRLVAAIGVALAITIVAVLAVPKLHAKVVPAVRSALSGLWSVARIRRKRFELFGGNVASELVYVLALGANCLAYGVDLSLAQLVFINTTASTLASVIPVPGGIGAAEAALSGGLIAMGVDTSTAFAVAITHRLCTFYLPPIWGYFSLQWLSRRGYV